MSKKIADCLSDLRSACEDVDADECAKLAGKCCTELCKADPPGTSAGRGATASLEDCDDQCEKLKELAAQAETSKTNTGNKGRKGIADSITPARLALIWKAVNFVIELYQEWRNSGAAQPAPTE
jgi:hypothetical protein